MFPAYLQKKIERDKSSEFLSECSIVYKLP